MVDIAIDLLIFFIFLFLVFEGLFAIGDAGQTGVFIIFCSVKLQIEAGSASTRFPFFGPRNIHRYLRKLLNIFYGR